MLKSVYINGGFYIGRYEAGREKEVAVANVEKPLSQKNKCPINNIRCSEAQKLASKVDVPEGYTSSLMFGVQWDMVMKYLEEKGATKAELKENSVGWGNYKDSKYTITDTNVKYGTSFTPVTGTLDHNTAEDQSILLTTGANINETPTTKQFVKQNIYDLAGNVWEWTLERTSGSTGSCAGRGGSYGNVGSSHASCHIYCHPTSSLSSIGFRVALY